MGTAQIKNQICHTIDLDNPDKLILVLKQHQYMINTVINEDASQTPLIRAISKRNYTIANILLGEFGADVNKLTGRFTPLMVACIKDNIEMIELLTYFKADIQKRNKKDLSAVDYAIMYGSYKAIQFLKIQKRINVLNHFMNLSKIQKQAKNLAIPYVNYRLLQDLIRKNESNQYLISQIYSKKNKNSIIKNDNFLQKNQSTEGGINWLRKAIMHELSTITVGERAKTQSDQNQRQNKSISDRCKINQYGNLKMKQKNTIESYITDSSSP